MPQSERVARDRIDVLGVGVHAVDLDEAVRRCERLLDRGDKGYVSVTGVHGIMEAQRDPEFREILNCSFLCAPDGMPTVWVGRLRGHRNMRRVYGPDLMLEMCRRSVACGYRHFLYGGGPGTVERLSERLQRLAPGIEIVGAYTPPFRPLTWREEAELLAHIAEARPDIVWVGLSTPKQEHFMAQMLHRLDTHLMIGVGAAFDLHAGLRRDAPAWMKYCGLQWLHRLLQEPRRLGPRYFVNNPLFAWKIAGQLAGMRRRVAP